MPTYGNSDPDTICPLLAIVEDTTYALCLKSKCAWWVAYGLKSGLTSRCALVDIAEQVGDVGVSISNHGY